MINGLYFIFAARPKKNSYSGASSNVLSPERSRNRQRIGMSQSQRKIFLSSEKKKVFGYGTVDQ